MSSSLIQIRLEQPNDEAILLGLSAEAFGPGRYARTAYRVREGIAPVAPLSLAAWLGDRLIGGVRFTAIDVGGTRGGLLLGPLVVDPAHTGQGCGSTLIKEGLKRAAAEGFSFVLLVGDMPYYGRFGFSQVPPGRIMLPGPVDQARLLAIELTPGTVAGVSGQVKGRVIDSD